MLSEMETLTPSLLQPPIPSWRRLPPPVFATSGRNRIHVDDDAIVCYVHAALLTFGVLFNDVELCVGIRSGIR